MARSQCRTRVPCTAGCALWARGHSPPVLHPHATRLALSQPRRVQCAAARVRACRSGHSYLCPLASTADALGACPASCFPRADPRAHGDQRRAAILPRPRFVTPVAPLTPQACHRRDRRGTVRGAGGVVAFPRASAKLRPRRRAGPRLYVVARALAGHSLRKSPRCWPILVAIARSDAPARRAVCSRVVPGGGGAHGCPRCQGWLLLGKRRSLAHWPSLHVSALAGVHAGAAGPASARIVRCTPCPTACASRAARPPLPSVPVGAASVAHRPARAC